ncbi:hypothetical protein [Phycicoccus sp. Soil748]|uniref:hypothetical protein n=1 Tax=Phycicoccus sp. Soil748 TaxID=1736397 RepID=UPI00070328FB|nr:hypothetical protein [Phycicoccus sp. Soil748]KRE57170.1 hypothetical protein ASG70_01710 [Phycicoccus sp. Soil748]
MTRAARRYAVPLAVYLLSRVVTTAFILMAVPGRVVRMEDLTGYHSTVTARLPADYGSVVTSWDGQWYWDIVLHGYPSTVVDTGGHAVQSSLAFFPLYPALVKAGMAVTGLGFEVVAPTLSLLLGAAAVLVVFRLLEVVVDRGRALACTALLCCFPATAVLQSAYTESLGLLFVATTLLLLVRRRYLWCLVPVVLLGLTRNITLVLAPVVALHWLVAVRRHRRALVGPHVSTELSPPPRHGRLALLVAVCVAATAEWPLLAGALTGDPRAYFTTLAAWPGYTESPLDPPWLGAAGGLGIGGWVGVAVLVLAFVGLLGGRTQRAWGPELWGWTVAYCAYIFLASGVTSSLVRYLMLAFPFGLVLMPPAATAADRRAGTWVVVVFCALELVGQYVWVAKFLVYTGPTGGFGYP